MGGKGFRGGKGGGKGCGKGRRPGAKSSRKAGGKGSRKGGKPRIGGARPSKGSTRSSAGVGAAPRPFGAPAPLPNDPIAPFLHPSARSLVKVPLEFTSLRHWCDVIGNNILAEFWHVFREATPAFTGFGGACGDELIIDNAPSDGLTQHLLLVNRQPRLVSSQRVLGVGKIAVKLRGGGAQSGQVKSLGYVGSFLAEFAATLELRQLPPQELTGPMRAILEPKRELPGEYARRPLNTAAVPVNPSQRAAVEGLGKALEKIQGPPGTGKSTTIFHILDARVPKGARVLVTCSRNVAVESIAQKLAGLDDWPLCVFGPRDRVGETARRNLLDEQVGGQFDEVKLQRVAKHVAKAGQALSEAISFRERACRGRRCEAFLLSFLRWRHSAVYALRDMCDQLGSRCSLLVAAPEWCKQRQQVGKDHVLDRSRVFLCTIASTSRLLREWEEVKGSPLSVQTVIVDECGCTPESSTALLLRLRPSNLVLVGDHKQLPPCSTVQPQLLEGTGHTRSLLERCVLASGHVHQLREQYRMHPAIANVVSKLFYAGRLQTPGAVAASRKARESQPLLWLDVQGTEAAPERSYMNVAEVRAATRACARLREDVGAKPSIALLTFYRGQLRALMVALPSELDVEVLTVDACQGSEFDYVVLSTVRANRDRRLGFVKDQQRINVAISRSRLKLLVVGSRYTLGGDDDWREVQAACQPARPEDVAPKRQLPAEGTFESVYDSLCQQKQREAEQKASAAMEESGSRPRTGKGGKGDKGGKGKGGPAGVSVEALMRQQGSMRRQKNGTYQSSNVVAIGGGFRRRSDIAELEACAAHHHAKLEPQRTYQAYRAARDDGEYQELFPTLAGGAAEPGAAKKPVPSSAPHGKGPRAGNLRASTLNDERRARKAAQRAATAAEREAAPETLQRTSETQAPDQAPAEYEWADVSEAMLFEMFPDDADAVEEALLRFAGVPHAAARAFEALLARSSTTAAKRMLDAEDDLDYDCVFEATAGDAETEEKWCIVEEGGFGDGGEAEEGEVAEVDEEWAEEEWVEEDWCAYCGEHGLGGTAEDEYFYCSWCWAAWDDEEDANDEEALPAACASAESRASATGAAGASRQRKPESGLLFQSLDGPSTWADEPERPMADESELVALPRKDQRNDAEPCLGRRQKAGAATAPLSSSRPAPSMPSTAPKAGAVPSRKAVGFFEALDGAPGWAAAPPRPEAGGKELLKLEPKGQRPDDDAQRLAPRGNRWSRASKVGVDAPVPAAAVLPKAPKAETPADRCRSLMRSMLPSVEDSVLDYIVSVVEDDLSVEARELVVEILEGSEVPRTAAETFWERLSGG